MNSMPARQREKAKENLKGIEFQDKVVPNETEKKVANYVPPRELG